MKTLWLLRHARTIDGLPGLADRDRPLEARGEHDAVRMGTRWGRRFGRPDAIVASPALRAITTARLVAERLGFPAAGIVVEPRLYDAGTDTLVALIEAFDDRWDRVMVVGHNPTLSDLARRLDPGIVSMQPCSLAEFAFEIASWSDVDTASPLRSRFDSPSHPDA